ncbi:MAG: 5-formyltetrahydrofolate cyclo-ligase [Gallionellaceae bacterium]|jgi:5-formyltetrahydrofolate cyclo-ligase|nr:5-formyltetrahydrofolate cyclo-ligase [Gallionellaceae bacterium]
MNPTKSGIRKTICSLREQLLPEVRAAYSTAITERLVQLAEYRQAGTVLGYMNFGAEFASEMWIAHVLAEGKRLVLPKVNHHTNHLDLYRVDDPDNQLAQGLWGIREPIVERCERVSTLNEVEFILLPGVAFARDGSRLGYGGGFYDKLLSRPGGIKGGVRRPVLFAAAFALQIVEHIPQEATDIKVDWIVTEQETIVCSAQE